MIASESILVGEGWISEYYFTSDARARSFQSRVLQRRKEWDADATDGHPTPRTRFGQQRQSLEVALAALGELTEEDGQASDPTAALEEGYQTLLDVLGLTGHLLRTERTGPLLRISLPQITERAPLAVVFATATPTVEALLAKDEATLLEPIALTDEDDELTSAARLVSALFVEDDGPDLIVIMAGRWAVLAERERWAEGRYLAVDVQLVCERNDGKRGGEIDRALTCLSAESIAPDADGGLWWHGVFEESVKHTVGVSQDLRDGVRLSIEIIVNEVVNRRADCGFEPLPGREAQPLAQQALRFLYRILFLLYAEASPELGVLPAGAQEYDQGYSLDRLRELVQVELATPQARSGTHLYDSLGVLFRLVDTGHQPTASADDAEDGSAFAQGLIFNPLRADLFRPEATAHIDAAGLGNAALQQVLRHLLLSKEKRGRDRGFISYAELGINQLGAVYEGLMSYTGFFAETDLYEVAKGGDGSKGTWVVPVDRADGIAPADFVKRPHPVTEEMQPVLHPRGSFVFRLAGRERQQSASYYTPEVLTRFTVGQALEELLDQDGRTTTAAEILDLTVCEPALGSGAFAIEAVRQLAEQYLTRRQKELGRRIDPDDYPRRLQQIKAYIALHNVYGVDLNATAVELAEISLWLDTMVQGLSAPWFGLHLRRGNSLIGARRAVYSRRQLGDRSWLTAVPRDVPLTSLVADIGTEQIGSEVRGAIHHFLLPAEGWGAAADAKDAKELAPDATAALNGWRRSIKTKPSKTQIDDLAELAHRVETLWQYAYQRLQVAEQEIRRSIPVWEAGELPVGGNIQREQIEAAVADAEGAYRRMRRVMDAWAALWFWPLTDTVTTVEVDGSPIRVDPPSLAQWIAGLQAILGRSPEARKRAAYHAPTLSAATSWDELGAAEVAELGFAGAVGIERARQDHPWLVVCERIADQQGFHHWELDFAPVFARGGFDLQVGNPPWVRPESDVRALLAEGDPWWQLSVKPSQALITRMRAATLAIPGVHDLVLDGAANIASISEFVGANTEYPHLAGLRPDLYRCFMERMWRNQSATGTIGMIHLESHFTDEKAGRLRSEIYRRLRRHWHFVNELHFFEIQNQKQFGVTIHGTKMEESKFLQASWLYHPDTVSRSLDHDGSGPEPGLKDLNDNWDLRPHASRILRVDGTVLSTWHEVLESDAVPVLQTRMVYAVNRSVAAVLDKLSRAPRIGELGLSFSPGWNETTDRKKGFFESSWGRPASWDDVILQGPHLYVANPMYKSPNRTMLHHRDWSATDFEHLSPDAIPVTAYKPAGSRARYDSSYTQWDIRAGDGERRSARDYYRLAWRNMAANTGERTLIAAIIPPGSTHVDGLYSAGSPGINARTLLVAISAMSSLLADFAIRVAPKSNIRAGTANRLPLVPEYFALTEEMCIRSLRLNAIVSAYDRLWSWSADLFESGAAWTGGLDYEGRPALTEAEAKWSFNGPLRRASDRRQALLEVDVLVAMALGITSDELCSIYRTQFAVLYGYDRNVSFFDASGRLVPNSVLTAWRTKGDRITEAERTATNQAGYTYVYELPFVTLDREADMRQAYAEFERRLAERS